MVLRCVFRGFGTFRGIKSGPVEQVRHASSFFWAFWGGLVRGRIQSGGRGGVNPSPGTGDWGFFAKYSMSTRPEARGLGGFTLFIPNPHF